MTVSNILISIDPGASSGFAVFRSGELVVCKLVDIEHQLLVQPAYARVVIENQVIAPHTRNPASIIRLAQYAGMWEHAARSIGCAVSYVYPMTWSGARNKFQTATRVSKALTTKEAHMVRDTLGSYAKSKRHNVIDAIGIGLHALKRIR